MYVRIAFITLALLPLSLFARSYGDFDVAATPAWVETVQVDYLERVAADSARYGVYDLLAEHHARVQDGGNVAHYYRTARKIISATGVQNASELSVDFDPSYQKLVIHEVAIIRAGQRINALAPDDVRVIEKEDDADQSIYDGQLTALIFLKDVRAGDVLDYSWSLEGANPILRGHFADEFDLSSSVPSSLIRHRLIWPADRLLQHKSKVTPTIEVRDEQQFMTWERRNASALNIEDGTPTWYEPWQSVEVTDFETWSDVARWGEAMFAVSEESRAAVRTLAGKIRTQNAADPVTAAIRFVQDDIRYLGIEIGRNSHEPRQPSVILEQRWGDCKEKALLLSMLLRELGVSADPALVSTRLRRKIDSHLPSPFAFDHVIVRVTDGGKTRWIDPTIAYQGGTLATIDTPDDGRALVIASESEALTPIQTRNTSKRVIDETYVSRDRNAPTMLRVRTTYTGGEADAIRALLASTSTEELGRQRMNRHASEYPDISIAAKLQVYDDRLKNEIVTNERYAIRNLWKSRRWTFHSRMLEPYLDKPATVIRSMPLAIDHPLDITHRATFVFPTGVNVRAREVVRSTPAFRFASSVRSNRRRLTAEYSLRSVRDSVDTRQVALHLATVNEIRDDLALTMEPTFQLASVVSQPQQFPLWVWLLIGVVVALALKLSFSRHRWWHRPV